MQEASRIKAIHMWVYVVEKAKFVCVYVCM